MSEFVDQDAQERFVEFLRTYRDEQGSTPYWSKIQMMSISEDYETSLVVDFQDLASFDITFAELANDDAVKFLNTADRALLSVLKVEDEEYVSDMGEAAFKVRFVNYPEHVKLRAIRSKHIGKLIHISGIMMRASEVKPLLVIAAYECRHCKTITYQPLEEGRFPPLPVCSNEHCSATKTSMRLIPEASEFRDWQKVRIQESHEELPSGQMPRSVDVILEGDIVDISRPGDFVKITGILKTAQDFSRRGGKLATFRVYIDANGVEIAEKDYEQEEISEEDEKKIWEISKDPYVHERIYASIAPSIKGHEHIKESIALLLFGGVEKTLTDGTRLRGRSNILMIGDPGTGKSQILKFVAGLASRGLYTSGKGTTAAGLTAAVVHDTDTGAMTLEAGALVLADKGIACIDEFDKMDPNDRTAIHEAMEQHSFHPQTEILLANGARTPIGTFVDQIFDNHPEKIVKGVKCEIVDTKSMEIELYTTDFAEVRKTGIDRVSRHPAPDFFIRINFDNGRDIVVTPDHPLFVFQDNQIETVSAEEVEVGAFVPAPRRLPSGHNPGAELVSTSPSHWSAKPITTPSSLTTELARILGYYVTEGYSYKDPSSEIGFSTTSELIRDDIVSLMWDLFGIEGIDHKQRAQIIRYTSTSLMEFFSENFPEAMDTAPNRRAPPQVFISGEKALLGFLQSAFLGDGSVESEGICYRTPSRGLAYDYQDLLLGVGIQSRILVDSHNNSYKVYIRGCSYRLFRELVVEDWDPRINSIERIVEQSEKSNYSHDVFPPSIVKKLVALYKKVGIQYDGSLYRSIHEGFGIQRTVLKRHLDSVKDATQKAEMKLSSYSQSLKETRSVLGWSQETAARKLGKRKSFFNYLENGGYSPDVRDNTMIDLRHRIQDELEEITSEIERIDGLLERNIRCLRIEGVERVINEGTFAAKYAYDVTVEPEHSFISQGTTLHNTVSIAKAGIVATLNARTSILAAANPTLGRYEPSLSVQDNIKLPFTILSRFDLIWILVDTVEATKDRELAQFILGMHQFKEVQAETKSTPIPQGFLKKYIVYANNREPPILTAEAAEVIENFYVDLRKSAEGGAAPVPITARQLESLVRLSEARAKMGLRSKVTREDAQAAVRLMEESLKMVALDRITGKIDIDRLVSKMSAAQRTSADVIIKVMKDFEDSGTKTVDEDVILKRAEEMGLARDQAEDAIRKLEADGTLFRPGGEGKSKLRRA